MLDGFFGFQFRSASPDEPGSCAHFVYTRSFTILAFGIRAHGDRGSIPYILAISAELMTMSAGYLAFGSGFAGQSPYTRYQSSVH
jgi:hypothetical protein